MPLTQVSRPSWEAYLDRFSRAAGAARTWVEVTGLGLAGGGHDYLPLTLVAYDMEADAFTVLAGGEARAFAHPQQLYVDHDDGWVHAIEMVDGDGVRHYLVLKEAIELGPGDAAGAAPAVR